MYAKLAISAFVALAPVAALANQPSGESAEPGRAEAVQTTTERAPAAERRERLMCRRIGLTGQPTSIRRVCKTGAQWREIDDAE